MTEDSFDFSISSKKSFEKSISSEENQFSFSFNPSSPSHYHKSLTTLSEVLQRTLNSHLFSAFQSLKSSLRPFAAKKILSLFKLKKKRAAYIKWFVQSIKISSESKLQSAITTASQLNTFSRRYISCSILYNLFHKTFCITASKLLSNLSSQPRSFSLSLLPGKSKEKWLSKGFFLLFQLFNAKHFSLKSFSFKALSSDLSMQRQAFIQSTDRCIELSEQLFLAKEAKEKAEFEKEELVAVVESKTEELNKLIDIVEEYKMWQGKLGQLEGTLNEEVEYWKSQSGKFSSELEKKNKEVVEVYSDKKKAEEECLKAYRNLDLAQKENMALQKTVNEKSGECKKCESFKSEISTYEEIVEEYKKNEEKYLENIKDLQEQLSRPVSVASNKNKPGKIGKKPVKKTLELEKSISENENQLGIEIVNLNKQLSKYKHENKTLAELLKKCQTERDEMKKIMIGKDEALVRLRKENDQLCLSLSTDHYKSVHKLEHANLLSEQKTKDLLNEVSLLQKTVEETKNELGLEKIKSQELESEIQELKTCQRPDTQKLVETIQNLQSQFFKLKEMSDKQIQTIESLKQDNYQLMQTVESFKSLARSNKLHADKAVNDAETYSNVIKKMEAEIFQLTHSKDSAEKEVQSLKQHLMKLINRNN